MCLFYTYLTLSRVLSKSSQIIVKVVIKPSLAFSKLSYVVKSFVYINVLLEKSTEQYTFKSLSLPDLFSIPIIPYFHFLQI